MSHSDDGVRVPTMAHLRSEIPCRKVRPVARYRPRLLSTAPISYSGSTASASKDALGASLSKPFFSSSLLGYFISCYLQHPFSSSACFARNFLLHGDDRLLQLKSFFHLL